MEKFVKLQSVQAGPFTTPSNRHMDFDFPQNHLIDMSKSFVQLVCSIDPATAVEPNDDLSTAPYNLCIKSVASSDYNIMNLELIRNCYLNSGSKGQLENLRRVNVLRKNLMELTKLSTQKLSMHDSLFGVKTFDNKKLLSPFVEFHKVGSITSAYKNASLRIPMSHLFELGNEVLDTTKLGKIRCHLELEQLSNLAVELVSLEELNDNGCNNLPTQGGNELVITKVYDTLENSPFWVGERVRVSANGGDYANVTIITEIKFNEATGVITLVLQDALPALTAPAIYEGIVVSNYTPDPLPVPLASFHILTAEVCLATVDSMKVEVPNELQYFTFTTEEYSVNQDWMNKVFEIEPEAVNVWCMFNRTSTATKTANLLSVNNDLENYFLSINDKIR